MAQSAVTFPLAVRHRKFFETTWDNATPISQVRFISLDLETTGLNPRTAGIVSMGAVAVRNGEILIEDSYEALLKLSLNTDTVTVHGITRDQSREGMEEPEALERFLDYLKDGVIVGHHIGHDLAMLDAACERHWQFQLLNRSLDTMNLALHLERAGAFSGRPPIREFTLDALCEMFGVAPHGRHTASGDAFLTAQIFLRLARLAMKYGRDQLGQICEPFEESPA